MSAAHCPRQLSHHVPLTTCFQDCLDQSAAGKSPASAASPAKSPAAKSSPGTTAVAAAASAEDAARAELLQKQLTELREEYDFYKKEQAENVKMLTEQTQKLTDQLTEHRCVAAEDEAVVCV